jgi:hypothetical protein
MDAQRFALNTVVGSRQRIERPGNASDNIGRARSPEAEVERNRGLFDVDLPHPWELRRVPRLTVLDRATDLLGRIRSVDLPTLIIARSEKFAPQLLHERALHPGDAHLEVSFVGLGLFRPVATRTEYRLEYEGFVRSRRLLQEHAQW